MPRGWARASAFPIVGLAALGIEVAGMGHDVAEEEQRMGRERGVRQRVCERAIAQAARLVEPAEQQSGATQRVAGLPVEADDPPRRLTVKGASDRCSAASRSQTRDPHVGPHFRFEM